MSSKSAELIPASKVADRALNALAAMLVEAANRRSLRVVVDVGDEARTSDRVGVSRLMWAHGELSCPGCGLHLDPVLDLEDREWVTADSQPVAVRVKHRRCGGRFRLEFARPQGSA